MLNANKKAIFLIFIFLPTILSGQILGDVNWDNCVDIVDAMLISQYYVGAIIYEIFDPVYADVDFNKTIDISDSLLVAQFYVGIISVLPPNAKSGLPLNWHYVSDYVNISAAQEAQLMEKGFVIMENQNFETFGQAYEDIADKTSIPIFITSDVMMQIFHLTYTHLISEIENAYLIDILDSLIHSLYQKTKTEYLNLAPNSGFQAPMKMLIEYIAVAKALIEGSEKFNDPELPADLLSNINLYVTNIAYYSPTYGTSPDINSTPYKPRGHYLDTESPNEIFPLTCYFQALKWLQINIFTVYDSQGGIDTNLNLEAATILAWLVETDTELKHKHDFITNVLTGFGGPSEYFSLDFIHNALSSNQDFSLYNTMGYFALDEGTIAADFTLFLSEQEKKYKSIQLIPDLHQLDYTILDSTHKDIDNRNYPSGLDVASVLFNSTKAEELLKSMENNSALNERIEELKQIFQNIPPQEWSQYTSYAWFHALASLSNQNTSQGILQLLNSNDWNLAKLNSQLSSWTEFHSDSVDYRANEGITPTPEITPTPAIITPPPGESKLDVTLNYKPISLNPYANEIRFDIEIQNNSDEYINLQELKIYYFYESESSSGDTINIYFSPLGKNDTIGIIDSGYAMVTFTSYAGYLKPGASTGFIQVQIHRNDWQNFDQRNDFSFDPTPEESHKNIKMCISYFDHVIFGICEPGINLPTPTPELIATPTPNSTPVATPVSTETPQPPPSPSPVIPTEQNFIEPNPDFFNRYNSIITNILNLLDVNNIHLYDHELKLRQLQNWAILFENIASNLQKAYPLTDDEKFSIKQWAWDLKDYFSGGWFIRESRAKTRVIADIYSYQDKVYHGAVGNAQMIILLIKPNQSQFTYAAIGFLQSYYEIKETDYNRISDEEWIEILGGAPPPRPSWMEAILQN